MTRRLLQNQAKISELHAALDNRAARTDSAAEFAKRQLLVRLENNMPQAKTPRRRPWIAMASAAALLVGGVFMYFYLSQTYVVPDDLRMPPVSQSVSRSSLPTMVEGLIDALPLNMQVKVPDTDGAKFVLDDQSAIWAARDTELAFQSSAGDLNLTRGRLLATFNPRNTPTRIHTAHGTVKIIGTVFSITAGANATEIRLFEGKIAVVRNGKTRLVQAGNYVRIDKDASITERTLDTSDVISALLITEETFHLAGPAVPELQIPDQAVAAETEVPKTNADPEKIRKRRKRTPPSRPPTETEAATAKAEKPYALPPEDDMQIEHQPAGDSAQPEKAAIPAAEQLLEDACNSLKKGDHKTGKEKIRDYLKEHRTDRYWEHVQSIFDDTP